MVTDSILDTTKKLLGISPDDPSFDLDIVTHINTVFFTMQQLGVGPAEGFMITDNTAVWNDFIQDKTNINAVRSYMGLRVRLLFDPPAMSFVLESIKKQIEEYEWRLNVAADSPTLIPDTNISLETTPEGVVVYVG